MVEFFNILTNVAMINGTVVNPQGKNEITLYTSCMCQEKGLYSYRTYINCQINIIDMHKENFAAPEMKVFHYYDNPNFNYQN